MTEYIENIKYTKQLVAIVTNKFEATKLKIQGGIFHIFIQSSISCNSCITIPTLSNHPSFFLLFFQTILDFTFHK